MEKTKIIADAFAYSMRTTAANLGLYCLSILATIGIIVGSTILCIGSYVLIIAQQIPTFQELLRLFFAGKAIETMGNKIVPTEQALHMTKMVLSSINSPLIMLGIILFIIFSIVLAAIIAGHMYMLLNLYDTGQGSISDFFAAFSYAPPIYVLNFLAPAAALPFLILFPFIYAIPLSLSVQVTVFVIASLAVIAIGSRFYLAQYFFIDDEKTILQSLIISWRATKDVWPAMILLIFIGALLSFNTTAMLLGQFPLMLMAIYIYRSINPSGAAQSE